MSNRVLGIAQRGTETGLTRIRDMVTPGIDFVIVEDFKKSDWANGRLDQYGEYAGILSQCMTHVPADFRDRCVLFGLGSANRRIMKKKGVREYMEEHPFREFWVNNNTIAEALKKYGFDPRVMYRANQVVMPKSPYSLCRNRIIAWYCNSWNGCLRPYKSLAKETIALLRKKKISVLQFPHADGWGSGSGHVAALGKVRVSELMNSVCGLVRLGEIGDFGRVYYDVLASGRWILGYELDEPWTKCITSEHTPVQIANYIEELVETDTEEDMYDRWTYAKTHYTDKAMTSNWTSNIKRVFDL